jgi:hypothetical protein
MRYAGRDTSPRLSQNSVCILALGGRTGERIEVRGMPNKNAPPLPSPLLHFAEEREKTRSLDKF